MRTLLAGLLLLVAFNSFAVAAVDPAEKEAAVAYEQAVQAGNKAFKETNTRMQGILLGLTAKKIPDPVEATTALADFEKAVAAFQSLVKEAKPPTGKEADAYVKAVDSYLASLGGLAKDDYRKIIASLENPTGTPDEKMAVVAPLLAKASQTQQQAAAVGRTRKVFLKAYDIDPAAIAAAAPSGTTDTPAPAAGPVALDQAIKEGEKGFKESMEALQGKLLAKLALGGPIDPEDIESSLTDIDGALTKFESQLAAAPVPDDEESKAYAAAAKKLLANLKKADFAGLAKVLTNKTLPPEAKQAQLLQKAGALQATLGKETENFEKAQAAFAKKHGL
jgi:hypothetical protein